MSYIQLPYGFVKNNKHITNKNPAVENNILNLLKNREDLKKMVIGH